MKRKNHRNGKRKSNHQNLVKREPNFPILPNRIEEALINGDLKNLTPEERIRLYMETCRTLKLNPMTKPFGYILMKDWYKDEEKLILYATRNCTDQLRSVYGAGDVPGSLKREQTSDELTAEIAVVGRNGRVSQDVGVIPMRRYTKGGGSFLLTDKGKERELANAKMHAVTKARRRATLALYGLGGVVDESELDTMNIVGGVTKEGRIWRYVSQPPSQRELVDGGDYPRGGPRSELAAAQLKKVEALDVEFASEVANPPLPAKGTASKPMQSTPAEPGRSGDTPRASAQGAKATGGPPPRPPAASTAPRTTVPAAQTASGERKTLFSGTPQGEPENAPERPATTERGVPRARIPHKIVEVKRTSGEKGIEIVLDTGHRMYTFRNHKMDERGTGLFELLLKSVGKMIICTSKIEKNYMHIDKVYRIGELEWDDEGVPVIRREPAGKPTREPGEEG